MRNLIVTAMLGVAVLAAGCSGCSVLSNDRGLLSSTLADEKTLYAAEAAMYGADTAAGAAVDAGLLKPGSPDAVAVADWLEKAHGALKAARAAYEVGDAATVTNRIASTQDFIAEAWRLLPQKKG